MPRTPATSSMVSVDSQPFSSCATINAPITADCFWSAGYFCISLSISSNALAERVIARLPVHVPEHDVDGADDRHRIGQHVAFGHFVHRREVGEPRRAQLHAVGLVDPVRDEIDAEIALRMLHRPAGLTLR